MEGGKVISGQERNELTRRVTDLSQSLLKEKCTVQQASRRRGKEAYLPGERKKRVGNKVWEKEKRTEG